jgi:hypothetical protein
MALTDTKCRTAKGQIKLRKLSDGGGLHLLITPDGAKYWRLAYRWHGKQRTLALGVYPAVGLIEARASRDDAKRSIAANIDPSVVKRERNRAAKIATGNTSKRSHANGTRIGRTPVAPIMPRKSSGAWRRMRSQPSVDVRSPLSNRRNYWTCCARSRSAG